MWTWRFWREAFERAVKSAAQAEILAIGAGKGFDLFQLNWKILVSAVAGGAALSILTSLATSKIGADDSPSAIP